LERSKKIFFSFAVFSKRGKLEMAGLIFYDVEDMPGTSSAFEDNGNGCWMPIFIIYPTTTQ
jgi:hypothetical protein